MFEAKINDAELKLVLHLHEIATGFGPAFAVNVEKIVSSLKVDKAEAVKSLSYLAQHGLIGTQEEERTTELRTRDGMPHGFGIRHSAFESAWLTGVGENFCRSLLEQPSFFTTTASPAIAAFSKEAIGVARAVLTEITKIAVISTMHLHQ